MADADGLGGLVNRRALPVVLLALAGLLILLSFAVGWFSIDATLRRWAYDQSAPPDYDGAFIPPLYRIDLEMQMLSIATDASPEALRQTIDERGGTPNYDDHAGRMGTVMLGMLMMQLVVLLSFIALAAFYGLHRRGRRELAPTVKRLAILFAVLVVASLLYFMFRMGGAAREDEEYILSQYQFNDQVAYAPLEPEIGFWKNWRSDKTTLTLPNNVREVWEFQVESRPSAGWWLSVGSLACVLGARIVAQRNGEFDEEPEPLPPGPGARPVQTAPG